MITKQKYMRWLQPFALPSAAQETKAQRNSARQRTFFSDAQVVVTFLNESKKRRNCPSFGRISTLLDQLHQTRNASEQYQRQAEGLRRKIMAREKSGIRTLEVQLKTTWSSLEVQHRRINTALRRYVFRPAIGYTAITDIRSIGFLPDRTKAWFEVQIGQWALSEADAAAASVRLYEMGELERVKLCKHCAEKYIVAAKSHYSFCSRKCYQSYYSQSPEYHARKAEIQRNYRRRNKLAEAASLS